MLNNKKIKFKDSRLLNWPHTPTDVIKIGKYYSGLQKKSNLIHQQLAY